MKNIEIPFGASDSEPYYEEIIIPDGLEAIMEDGKIILRKKETEDDKIIRAIIAHIKDLRCYDIYYGVTPDEMVAWLEKQKPKPLVKSALEAIHEEKTDNSNKVELDFKIGDWIVENGVDRTPIQITAFEWDNGVITKVEFNNDAEMYIELLKYYHKWTIQEARDGDVLVSKYDKPFIYNGKYISDSVGAHCGIDIYDRFIISTTDYDWTDYDVKPATKEQSDLLFQEMKDAGWEWDAEKKKLKRMQKAKWSEEDSKAIDNCCLLIAAADDSYEKSFKDDCIHYLQNLKQQMTNDNKR